MKTIYITEEQKNEIKRAELLSEKKKPTPQEQVHNKVNSGIMDAMTIGGTMEEESIKENSYDRKINNYIKEKYGITDFNDIRQKVIDVYKKIPYARIDGGKYLIGVFRLLYDENLPKEQYPVLNKILYSIGKYSRFAPDSNLEGMSFEELKSTFFKKEFDLNADFGSYEKQIKCKNGYTITRIDSFEECELRCDDEWCISNDRMMWDDVGGNNGGTVYIVENEELINRSDEFEETHPEKFHEKLEMCCDEEYMEQEGYMDENGNFTYRLGSGKFPYDDYGLSRFVVVVWSEAFSVYSRYNIPNCIDGDYLSKEEIERLLGVKFESVFKNIKNNVEEGAEPGGPDVFMLGPEKSMDLNPYYHLNEGKENESEIRERCHEIELFMEKEGLKVSPFPELNLDWSEQDGLFIRTGFYSPNEKAITVFCQDRHEKDILRSFSHELIHHMQNLEGKNLNFSGDDDVKDNKELEKIEAEAYLKGNIYFRKWTEYENTEKQPLNESALDVEYHYTTIENLKSILTDWEFTLRDKFTDSPQRKRTFFMSLTRIRSCKEGYGLLMNKKERPVVRIELNGRALNNIRGVNVSPFDYWYDRWDIPGRQISNTNAEAEDSLTSDSLDVIPDVFENIINRIDILFCPFYSYSQYKDALDFLNWAQSCHSYYEDFENILHFYVNENNFNYQKKDDFNLSDLNNPKYRNYILNEIGLSETVWDFYGNENGLLSFESIDDLNSIGDYEREHLVKINLSKLNIREKPLNFSNEKRLISFLIKNGYDGCFDGQKCGYLTLLNKTDYFNNGIIQDFEPNFNPYAKGILDNINENAQKESRIIDETNPDDVDLSSFNIKRELNPKFWKNNLLDSRIRLKLLDIAEDFIDFLGVDWVKPDDIIMTGSLANFNWNKKYSDIDLHVLMDFSKVDKRKDFVKKYFDSLKNQWNEEHGDLKIFGFPVEVYVQDTNEAHASSGVYSLDKNEWLTEPKREKLAKAKVNKSLIRSKVAKYIDSIDDLIKLYKDNKSDNYKVEKISDKANRLWDAIKNERKSELNNGKSEISNGNIVFKSLRRLNYLDKLYKLKTLTYDNLNSLP